MRIITFFLYPAYSDKIYLFFLLLAPVDKVLPLRPSLEAKTVPITGYTRAMVKSMTTSLEVPHFGYKVRSFR